MTPESRILIEKLLRQELANLERDRRSVRLLAVTYHPEKSLGAGQEIVIARIESLEATARLALAEITGTPTDDL